MGAYVSRARPTSVLLLGATAALGLLGAVPLLPQLAAGADFGQVESAGPVEVDSLRLDDLSPGFLGIYRKIMEIEEEIRVHAGRYGVDPDLARAVCMYESGGNANLTSWAGAKGYFQVMPRTQRALRVDSNIEAGIKYLSQLIERFEREDYALAAYNGGPSTVGRRGRAMRLESLQYVLGVGHYRTLLKLYEPAIHGYASQLRLEPVREGDDWWSVARRLDLPLLQLRLHNPYLAHRELRPGYLVAYPPTPRGGLVSLVGETLEYRTRIGDNYFNLAFVFEVNLDELRELNSLWHLQTLPAGMLLHIPLAWEGEHSLHRVQPGESLVEIAADRESSPWRIIRDNALWGEQLTTGMVLRVRPEPPEPRFVQHRVRAGETLIGIANRYSTSVRSIQEANGMGNRTLIRIGEQLRIPDNRAR